MNNPWELTYEEAMEAAESTWVGPSVYQDPFKEGEAEARAAQRKLVKWLEETQGVVQYRHTEDGDELPDAILFDWDFWQEFRMKVGDDQQRD